ncbi:MAG: hypothetical protein AAF492_14125, partial [Verrucomicrobiota bacterium]
EQSVGALFLAAIVPGILLAGVFALGIYTMERIRWELFMVAAMLMWLPGVVTGAREVSQSIQLNPGWNAVYLEVDPGTNDVATLFQGVPIKSVWTYRRLGRPTEFIRNLNESLARSDEWLFHFPATQIQSFANNLFHLPGGRAYFIQLDGASAATWTVTGVPVVPRLDWKANRYNLVGFPLDPAASPMSVGEFFSSASALDGQPVYRLDPGGTWNRIANPAAETMRAGEAFWVYAAGHTDYTGPLQVRAPQIVGLDYGTALNRLDIELRNLTSAPVSVGLIDPVSGGSGPLHSKTINVNGLDTTVEWLDLPWTRVLQPGEFYRLRLGLHRDEITGGNYESTLELRADTSQRFLIPVEGAR